MLANVAQATDGGTSTASLAVLTDFDYGSQQVYHPPSFGTVQCSAILANGRFMNKSLS